VTVSSHIVKQLEDRGWIDAIGYREAPGRPALYATTKQFLDDMGLASLDQLPALEGGSGVEAVQALAMPQQSSLLDEVAAAPEADHPEAEDSDADDVTDEDAAEAADAAETPVPADDLLPVEPVQPQPAEDLVNSSNDAETPPRHES
jgi:segregation and condensation protein B